MINFFCIFTTGGVVLWAKVMAEGVAQVDIVNSLVKNILMMEKTNQSSYSQGGSAVKWRFVNELGLIFTCVYREILQITHIDQLLELINQQFEKEMLPRLITDGGIYQNLPLQFDDKFS